MYTISLSENKDKGVVRKTQRLFTYFQFNDSNIYASF